MAAFDKAWGIVKNNEDVFDDTDNWRRHEMTQDDLNASPEIENLRMEVKKLQNVINILKEFHITKNVNNGFTQQEWVELIDSLLRGY